MGNYFRKWSWKAGESYIETFLRSMRKAKRRSSIFGIIVFPDPGCCAKTTKGRRECKRRVFRLAGAKQCYAFVIVRIKAIDITAEEETSGRQFQENRAWRSRTDGEAGERDKEKMIVRMYMHIDQTLKTIVLIT